MNEVYQEACERVMYILTIYGKETEGAYSVADDEGDQILICLKRKTMR